MQRLKTPAKLVVLALALAPLPGCQSIDGSPTLSQVRIVNASPDAGGGAIDVYQGASILAYNLGFGFNTSYVQITPGIYSINVDAAGTKQQLVTATGTFQANQQYTALVGNYNVDLQEIILRDQNQSAPAGDISVRIIDQSIHAGAVDVYLVPGGSTLAAAQPLVTGLTFNSNTGYMNLPVGTYTLVIVPTGVAPTSTSGVLYSGPATPYPGGCARTFVITDTSVTKVPSVNVLTLRDFDSANESS